MEFVGIRYEAGSEPCIAKTVGLYFIDLDLGVGVNYNLTVLPRGTKIVTSCYHALI